MMRVLQVTAIPVTAERFVTPLADALGEAGFAVELATGPGRGLDNLEAQGYRVHRLPISRSVLGWRNLHAVGALRDLIRGSQFDIVHAHTPAASAVTRLAAPRRGVRVLYTMHGSLWGGGGSGGGGVSAWRRAAFTALERTLARKTDLVFTVNSEDAADCVRRAGFPADKVVTLAAGGAGVAPEFFLGDEAVQAVAREARRRLKLEANAPVIGYVGRTVAAKGMAILARAFARIARSDSQVRLLILGGALEGDRAPYSWDRFLGEVGPPGVDRVLWLGFRDRIAPLIAAMTVVVLPSQREGFGMSLAEAGALGRPVVATDTRGARAVVEPGVTGLLVPVGDTGALTEALLRLLKAPDEAVRLGAAGRQRAAAKFTRERVLRTYLECYASLRSGTASLAR